MGEGLLGVPLQLAVDRLREGLTAVMDFDRSTNTWTTRDGHYRFSLYEYTTYVVLEVHDRDTTHRVVQATGLLSIVRVIKGFLDLEVAP